MPASVLAVVVAAAVAWWSWRDRLAEPLARRAALARATGLAALILLLLDPGIAARRAVTRPLVLLDNSISMHAAGGRSAEAARLAASLGDTTSFGELAPGEPGGRSDLLDPLAGAFSRGRTVVVVTDGEITDAGAMPADLLAAATVRVLPRSTGPDIALTDVQAPLRITAGDTLEMDVDARRTPGARDSATVVVRDSDAVLLRGVLRFGMGNSARLHLAGVLPRGRRGEQWLRIERSGADDGEPGDDVRWWRLVVTPTPGVVVLGETPDWDSRALYRALKDVVEVPIKGYVQLQRGQWRRMDDLKPASARDVAAAARGADLLAVRGDTRGWRTEGKARLLWPEATETGDWYVGAGGASPITGAFAGVDADSLPAAAGILPLPGDSTGRWVGATARLARRGTPMPVIGGDGSPGGRTVTIGIDGLYRWALRGGIADQAWRTMVSEAASWLLATPAGDSMRAKPVRPVWQRGRPAHFRWTGTGTPVPVAITLRGPAGERRDTLRFDGAGDASLALGVGRYHYTLSGGGTGSIAIEPYSDELVPAAVTVTDHVGAGSAAPPRRSLRELLWLFAIAIGGFGGEWMLRRRLGVR